MARGNYEAFRALDPFFTVVMQGLSKFVETTTSIPSTTMLYLSFATNFQVGLGQRTVGPTLWRFIRDTVTTSGLIAAIR